MKLIQEKITSYMINVEHSEKEWILMLNIF